MKLGKFDIAMANSLAWTFDKYAVVKRAIPTKIKGFDDFKMTVIYDMIKCAVNYSGHVSNNDGVQKIEYVATIFVGADVDIVAGDEIQIFDEYKKSVMQVLAGEGAKHRTHGEYPIFRKGIA